MSRKNGRNLLKSPIPTMNVFVGCWMMCHLLPMEDGSQFIGKESVVINNILKEIADELEVMPEDERMTLHLDFKEQVTIEAISP